MEELVAVGWDAAVTNVVVDAALAVVLAVIVGHARTVGSPSVAKLNDQ